MSDYTILASIGAISLSVDLAALAIILWVLRDMRRDSLHYHRTTGAVLVRIWQDIQASHGGAR